MKSYEEVMNDLLERRDRYVSEQRQKKIRIMKTAASLCCCLVVLMGIGVWQSGRMQSEVPITVNDSVTVGHDLRNETAEPCTADTAAETSQTPPPPDQTDTVLANHEIRILEIGNMPDVPSKMFFALKMNDFIRMNDGEIHAYYGVNVFPAVPGDLERKNEEHLGIYRRKESGEVYHDSNKISYTNADHSRGIAVHVDKNGLPFVFCDLFADVLTRSVINGVEVGIARTLSGELYAEFLYQNVGFRIWTSGLTADELIAAVESLLV